MESVPAGLRVHSSPSAQAAPRGAGALAAEGAASGPHSFAGLLQSVVADELTPPSSASDGQTPGQDGQGLTAAGGNFWPLVVSAEPEKLLQQDNRNIAESAFSSARGTRSPVKSLLVGSGVSGAALEVLGGMQQRENGQLLTAAASDEAFLQLSGIGNRTADTVSQHPLYSATGHATSAETPIPMEPTRFIISPRLDAPHWQDAFGSRLVWMAKEKHQFVELRLNPPELGVVNVKMALHQNDASIAIGVHNAAVREAIEATLPRLRELLAESGVSLMNVDVSSSHGFSSDGGRGWAADHEGYESSYGALSEVDRDPSSQLATDWGTVSGFARGIVDRYA